MQSGYHTRVLLTAVLTAAIWHEVVLARSDSGNGGEEDASNSALGAVSSPKIGSRLFILANISEPFSVAPQPLPLTPAVAHARQQFLKTFALIEDAVRTASAPNGPSISARGDIDNTLTLSSNNIPGQSSSNGDINSSDLFARVGPIETTNEINQDVFDERAHIFPDEDTEPEYFLPRMKVDPLMLLNLDTPLPHNAYIQQMTPMGLGSQGGMCYEIVILEPEMMFNVPKFAGRSGSRPSSAPPVNNINPTISSIISPIISPIINSTKASAERVPTETQQQDRATISQNSLFNSLSTQGGLPIISPIDLVGTPVLRSLATFRGSSATLGKASLPDTHSTILQAVATTLNSTATRKLHPHFVVPQLPFESFFQRTG